MRWSVLFSLESLKVALQEGVSKRMRMLLRIVKHFVARIEMRGWMLDHWCLYE